MSAVFVVSAPASTFDPRESFLAPLTAIQTHARAASGTLRSAHDREDTKAAVVAHTWERFAAPTLHAVTAERLAAPAVVAIWPGLARSHG